MNPTTKINYAYDPAGNRISKIVRKGASDPIEYTWYVRDAQGNIMGVYTASGSTDLSALYVNQVEKYIYGSSRLGVYKWVVPVDTDSLVYDVSNLITTSYTRGHRSYELTNHLGNVLASISDKKIGVPLVGSSSIDYFTPDVVMAQDYYPFGMMMPGREYQAQPSRFGFNGKENDNDVKGFGNQLDYGTRIYDTRLGRFLSVDPLTKSYPMLTPYQFASNRPIDGIDMDGMEYMPYNTSLYRFKGGITANYKFDMSDAYITNVEKHNIALGLGGLNFNLDGSTNPNEKDAQADWERTEIPKRGKTALFSQWYIQMRNYNSQNLISKKGAPYASPQVDPSTSAPASVLSVAFEIFNLYMMYRQAGEMKQYNETHRADIDLARQSGAAFDKATRLVSIAVEKQQLPTEILNNPRALGDIVNWMIDGTTSDEDDRSGHNLIVEAWGRALMNNENAVTSGQLLSGTSSMQGSKTYGSNTQGRESTAIYGGIYVPALQELPDVKKAKEALDKYGKQLKRHDPNPKLKSGG